MPFKIRPDSRKLAVILHADVVGSTQLVQRHEATAHERLQDVFSRFSRTIRSYGGIPHEVRGDALLAEFARASDAVLAALSFQSLNAEHNIALCDNIRPELRVGISLAEVVVADGTLTGAGVVLAQRLEQLAEAGGVVVQGSVSETVPTRLPVVFESLGEKSLKGFDQPVRAFVTRLKSGECVPEPQYTDVEPNLEPLSTGEFAESDHVQPPDKPSIAVLPFQNMSGDPEQEYFADGLTEDLITRLSRFHDLFVIARHSSFAYKGKSPIIQGVGRELGVRYILEGSVQKSGDRIRITAQLIDGQNGAHLWAERYDRRLANIFDVQDEVTETIVGTLASGYGGRLRKAWRRRAQAHGSESVQAFDCLTRGLEVADRFTAEDNLRGRTLFEQAIELDPSFAKARGKLAWTYILEAVEGWNNDYEGALAKGLEVANRSVDSDDSEPWAHWALGACYIYLGKHDQGISELERAVELNPNDADVLADLGLYLSYAGRAEEGRVYQLRAMRLNPHHPEYYLWQLGMINHDAHRYQGAVAALQRLRSIEPVLSLLYLAASHAALGNRDEARKVVLRVAQLDPEATVEKWTSPGMAPYKFDADREHFRQNLHEAGLP